MEIKNSNRNTLLFGIPGLLFLALGGLPLLDRAWAHLAAFGGAVPGAREVLSLVVGAVLVSVAVVTHRRTRRAERTADAR
ncbi:hypothetical protein [Streptomyces sp. NBC_00038]|uniref:hypothetical protein n=1 Tax=Streptomyces sp. NBC_00038 TaxID=2903615 RepID=UPI00224DD9FD|nr:hypothetical protein [Streptomyces sp. NBC_00038]MCX5559242.1 hypothetical protein [Streptomyces sp. NBC_00038]